MQILSTSKYSNLRIFAVIICLLAVKMNFIAINGVIAICVLSIVAYIHFNVKFKKCIYNYMVTFVFALIVWIFITHDVQGFSNPIIFDHVRTSPISSYYSMRLNLDKFIAAIIIFSMHRQNNFSIKLSITELKTTMLISIICIATIMLPALLSGYIRFDPKIPDITAIWGLNNLLCVCFSEEVVFRLYVQNKLNCVIKSSFVSIALASLVFGFYHYYMNSSIILAILSSICGMFYGYAFLKTNNNVACSMITHFLLNLVHLLLFTYPHFLCSN